jgi:hypothetical protein
VGSDNPTHTSVTRSGYCVTVAFPCAIGGSGNSRSSGARCSGFRGTSPNIVILFSDGSMDGAKAARLGTRVVPLISSRSLRSATGGITCYPSGQPDGVSVDATTEPEFVPMVTTLGLCRLVRRESARGS